MRFYPKGSLPERSAGSLPVCICGRSPATSLRGTAGSPRAERKTPEGFVAARLRQPGRAGPRSLTPARGGVAATHREALKPPTPTKRLARARGKKTNASGVAPGVPPPATLVRPCTSRSSGVRPRRAAGAEPGFKGRAAQRGAARPRAAPLRDRRSGGSGVLLQAA